MNYQAVIFDLDGVIVSTDEYHYQAWKRMAEDEGIPFDREINERLRGVSRMASLAVILEQSSVEYTEEQKLALAERKNNYYRDMLNQLTPEHILPGVLPVLEGLEQLGIKIAIGSSSRNTPLILDKIGMGNRFDAVADGNQITHSKPDPEVFLLAAKKLGLDPAVCVVVEDADAGIDAALAGGMRAVGVGSAANYERSQVRGADLAAIGIDGLIHD